MGCDTTDHPDRDGYRPPELRVLGTLRDMTRGGAGSGSDFALEVSGGGDGDPPGGPIPGASFQGSTLF